MQHTRLARMKTLTVETERWRVTAASLLRVDDPAAKPQRRVAAVATLARSDSGTSTVHIQPQPVSGTHQ
jgi:hypothetical protein